jgi:hypothetical protein
MFSGSRSPTVCDMTKNKTILAAAAVTICLLGGTTPAGAAGGGKARILTPSSFAASNPPGCIQLTIASCTATVSAGSAADPTLRGSVRVVDPLEPVGVPGEAGDGVVAQQVVEDTITKATPQVTYEWTFVVDEAIAGEISGDHGTGWSSASLVVEPFLDDCPWFPYAGKQVFALSDTRIEAGSTFRYAATVGRCPGASSIPAGTHATLTARLRLDASMEPAADGAWNGGVSLAGAVRTASVTAS